MVKHKYKIVEIVELIFIIPGPFLQIIYVDGLTSMTKICKIIIAPLS